MLSKEDVPQIKSKILEIRTKLQSGEDPKTIAIVEGTDTFSVKGGDMGWKNSAQLPPDLVAKLDRLKNGTVLDLFKPSRPLYREVS